MNGTEAGPRTAFYCVADERYFLGAVAMLNSLRAAGHDEPVYLLDCGLSEPQRELLADEVTLVASPADRLAFFLSTAAPARHPADVMVLIDADMIVNRSLGKLIESAASGRVIAFRPPFERFVPEWREILDLGPLRPRPYLSAGIAILGGETGREVVRMMEECGPVVERDFLARDLPPYPSEYPFVALDQDVFNVILQSRIEADRIEGLGYGLCPNQPFDDLELVPDGAPRARYPDASEPYVLHHLAEKPWRVPLPQSIFSRLLVHHLLAPGAAIKVPPGALPAWLRPGLRGRIERGRIGARDRVGWQLRERLPRGLVARVDAARLRRAGR